MTLMWMLLKIQQIQKISLKTRKERIKEIIFKKVAKNIKAGKLDDFEAATKEEQDIMLAIDKKVDSYLENQENADKPFSDLVTQIENDNEIKLKSLKYVEIKRVSDQKLTQLSKNLDKELEVIDEIEGLYTDDEEIEPDKFEVKGVSEKIT